MLVETVDEGACQIPKNGQLRLGYQLKVIYCHVITNFFQCLNISDQVVFVDADTMPLCNIDDLFGYEELSACRDAGWPDCFNTGLFVLKPSLGW